MQQGYVVERILNKRINAKGKPEYFVKWLDYPLSQSTWEPLKNLQFVKDMIQQYEEQVHPQTDNISYARRGRPPKKEEVKPAAKPIRKRGRPRRRKSQIIEIDDSSEESEHQQSYEQEEQEESEQSKFEAVYKNKVKKGGKSREKREVEQAKVAEKQVVKNNHFQFGSQSQNKNGQNIMQANSQENAQEVEVVEEVNLQSKDSLCFSDVGDEIQVQTLKIVDGVKYFQVRFPSAIKWISNQLMRRYYPHELIAFYERHMLAQ